MSLIIKGVDMPKSGESMTYSSKEIIEIPRPHGRLIDADELFCKIDGIKGWDYGDESDMAISAAEALSAIDDSPTVIEAEVSE